MGNPSLQECCPLHTISIRLIVLGLLLYRNSLEQPARLGYLRCLGLIESFVIVHGSIVIVLECAIGSVAISEEDSFCLRDA